jgi:hypothetical protein
MKTNRNIFLPIFLLILSACSKPPDYPVKIEFVDNIKVITNPDYPRDGIIKYDLVEELNIGIEEGDEDYILNRPQDVKVSDNGTIYILDWGDVNIKVYDKNGKHLRTIGRKGQGPCEFDTPCQFDIGSDGNIYLLDSRNARVEIVDTNGVYINGFRLEDYCEDLKLDSANNIYFSKKVYTEDIEQVESRINIFKYSKDGKQLQNFGTFTDAKQIAVRTGENSSMSVGGPNWPTTVWTIDPDGRLFESHNEKYQISVHTPDGTRAYNFGREFQLLPFPQPKKRNMDNVPDDYKRLDKKFMENLPKYLPAFKPYFLFDPYGNLWLELFTQGEEQNRIYDVFSPDGIYLKQVIIAHRIFDFKDGKIYSIVRTEQDFRVVKRFRPVDFKS